MSIVLMLSLLLMHIQNTERLGLLLDVSCNRLIKILVHFLKTMVSMMVMVVSLSISQKEKLLQRHSQHTKLSYCRIMVFSPSANLSRSVFGGTSQWNDVVKFNF
mmetsp:Transcript_25514/g.35089  ORF Transcript_25514/g.35089 Transcript_25514/m.35089 type:complete len:104 (+) Transcript_25514:398-709(+)